MDLKEYAQRSETNKRHPWEEARLKMLAFFISRIEREKIILDIGSGDAYLASSIARKYPASKIAAVDINYNDALIEALSTNKPSNLSFYNELPAVVPDFLKSAGIVILMDVLEHTGTPDEFLHQICKTIEASPSPFFIITVPAYQTLYSIHDEKLGHFRRYNRKELLQLLKKQSFSIIRSGYCFNSLLIPRSFQVLKEKIIKKKSTDNNGLHNWRGNKAISFFLKELFWIEFKLSWYLSAIGLHIPGLTCYCLCQFSPLSSPATTKKKDYAQKN